jgi:hypothetical protein
MRFFSRKQEPEERTKVSDCCHAAIVSVAAKDYVGILARHVPAHAECIECGHPCREVYPPCPLGICDGSGLVGKTAYDSDSHNYYPDGDEPCLCTKSEPEHEPEV